MKIVNVFIYFKMLHQFWNIILLDITFLVSVIYSFHVPLYFMAVDENYDLSAFGSWWFSCDTIRAISLLYIFDILAIMCHGEFFLWSCLFGVPHTACGWKSTSFSKFEKFSVEILLNILSVAFEFILCFFYNMNSQVWPWEGSDFLNIPCMLLNCISYTCLYYCLTFVSRPEIHSSAYSCLLMMMSVIVSF